MIVMRSAGSAGTDETQYKTMAKATKKKKKADQVFNNRKRRIFRNEIPVSEMVFGVVFLAMVMIVGAWFFTRYDDYDPAERDISMETLEADVVEDNLWRTPLEVWVEPGSAPSGGAMPAIDTGIFPPTILDGGWTMSSRVQEFTEENLYEKINGAADQYFKYGFRLAHFLSIKNADTGLEMYIEVYDMSEFKNALGIFAAQRGEDSVSERSGAFYYMTEAGALGIIGPYYFKLSGSENSKAAQDKALQMLDAMQDMPMDAEAAEDPLFAVMRDGMGVTFDAIAYEMKDVFQFSFAKDFWFATIDEEQGMRVFAHKSEDEETAAALFNQLVDAQLPDYELIDRTDDQAILKHKFLDEYFIAFYEGDTLTGVDGAADQDTMDQALDQLLGALADEQEG